MLLDELVEVIEMLQQRISDHLQSLRENETRTRMALIDPLLQVLGWDVSDPSVVTPEYNVSGRWADYALLGPAGKPVATVEAKKLGEPLAQHRMQMLNYSNASDVEYAGLTDGDHWELYEVFQRGRLEDRRLLDISVAKTPAHESALQLLLLWRPNLASGQPVAARAPILSHTAAASPDEETLTDLDSLAAGAAVETPQQASLASTTGWVSLADFNPSSGGVPPTCIRYEDGSEYDVQYWFELVSNTAKWLWNRNSLTQNHLPVLSGTRSKISIVSTDPVHQNGDRFRSRKDVHDTPLIVEGHGSGRDMRERTKRLLDHCGANPADVLLRLE